MKKSTIGLVGLVAVLVIVGGFLLFHKNKTTEPSSLTTPSSKQSAANTTTNTAASVVRTIGTTQTATISANDQSASPETITVTKGDTVKITFAVTSQGTYHGGLQFTSLDPAVDSGPIAEGASGTATFTATKSFKFTPYWYKSSVQKDYFVTVNVI